MVNDIVDWIVYYIRLVWNWMTNEVNSLLNLPWESLPLWKWYLALLAVLVVAGLLAWALYNMWEALWRVLLAMVDLLQAFVLVLPYILGAGVVAFVVLYVIQNFNL